jgi:hypothetical protein
VLVYTESGNPSYAYESGAAANMQLAVYTNNTSVLPVNGTSQNYSAAAGGQNLYMSFTATAGQNLELMLSNPLQTGGSNNSFGITVTNAAGVNVTSTTCYFTPGSTEPGCRLSLWNLAAGTYTVVVTPPTNATISFTAILQPDVVGPALTDNTPTTVSLGTGQVERFTFNANAGDTVALSLSGITTAPTGQFVYASVYRPDTGAITTGNDYTYNYTNGSSMVLNLPNLPESGTYTVLVYTESGNPSYAYESGAAANMQLAVYTNNTSVLPANGTSQSYSTAAGGQNLYMSFTATAGQNLELMLSNVIAASGNSVTVNVTNPAGSNVSSAYCYVGSGAGCRLDLWNLAAGVYSVVVSPSTANSAMGFSATLQPDVLGPTLIASTPATIDLAAGQVERLTFNANAGDTVALNLSGVTTVPTGQYVYANVYRPDTGAITTSNSYASTYTSSGPAVLNLPDLPVSGTYTVLVYTENSIPGDAYFGGAGTTAQLTLVPSTGGAIGTVDSSGSFASTTTAPNVYLSFNANSGDNLELTLSNVSAPGATTNGFEVNVYSPAGLNEATFYCYASSPSDSCTQSLWNLVPGTYSVVVIPIWGGTVSFTAQLQPDVIGATLAPNTSANINLGAGQVERVTFSASAGDTVALQVSGVDTTPSGQGLYINVYGPNTQPITTNNYEGTFNAAGSSTFNLADLPMSGTYTAVIYTANGTAANAQLTMVPQ